jgi:hypothetical protein
MISHHTCVIFNEIFSSSLTLLMKFQPFLIPAVLSLLLPALQATVLLSVDALTQFCAKAPYQTFLEFLAESSRNDGDGDGDDDDSKTGQPFNELDSNGFGCCYSGQ